MPPVAQKVKVSFVPDRPLGLKVMTLRLLVMRKRSPGSAGFCCITTLVPLTLLTRSILDAKCCRSRNLVESCWGAGGGGGAAGRARGGRRGAPRRKEAP